MKKWCGVLVTVFLLVGLLLGVCPVYADEGMDVDIAIVGDDSDVDVDIYGDNPSIHINGQDIQQPTVIRVEDSGADRWSRTQLRKVVFPWLEETQTSLLLTMDGLAKLILVSGSQAEDFEASLTSLDTELETGLEDCLVELDTQRQSSDIQDTQFSQRLDSQQVVLEGMQTQIETNHTSAMNYLEYRMELLGYNYTIVLVGLLGLIVILFVLTSISLWKLGQYRRRS